MDSDNTPSWNDSENKMIRDLEDNYLKELDIDKLKIEIELHSIYHPCSKCQEVISIFQKTYNAKIKIWSTEAKGNTRFIELYPNLSTKNN